ncbi:hypothetical protein [Polyangium sorediatum]|uniref:Uncharacterized protein n=1 Tax=Polyangium sorediatum TaxID=889274 RepID=A0ABT6PAZ6_9BACT|nr:hypothetical protein [Polyangium sorediatum]MDI1437447.1 hypothetical protein [Polyangium sorediatum]
MSHRLVEAIEIIENGDAVTLHPHQHAIVGLLRDGTRVVTLKNIHPFQQAHVIVAQQNGEIFINHMLAAADEGGDLEVVLVPAGATLKILNNTTTKEVDVLVRMMAVEPIKLVPDADAVMLHPYQQAVLERRPDDKTSVITVHNRSASYRARFHVEQPGTPSGAHVLAVMHEAGDSKDVQVQGKDTARITNVTDGHTEKVDLLVRAASRETVEMHSRR